MLSSGAALESWSVNRSYSVQSSDHRLDRRWPVATAVALMVGASLVLWLAIIAAIVTLL